MILNGTELTAYEIINDFVKWCEDTSRTEWLGYYKAFEGIFEEYIEHKRGAENEAEDFFEIEEYD